MLDSPSWVRCSRATQRRIDLSSRDSKLSLTSSRHPATAMKKAISLDVRLYIESEDEPAHDFAQSTTQAVREIIEAGSAKYPGLAIKVRSIREKS